MPVYLAAGLTLFFYILALPVRFGAAWRSGHPLRIGLTVGPARFSAMAGVQYVAGSGLTAHLTRDGSGKTRELHFFQGMPDAAALPQSVKAVSRALRYLRRHVKPHRLRARVHLSLPDAAATAFLFGMLNSALSAVHAARPALPLSAFISADFRSGRTQADFCGILSCRLGHIMAAALIWGQDSLARRLQLWRNSRLKAS